MKAFTITSSVLTAGALSLLSVISTVQAQSTLSDNVVLRACERASTRSEIVQARLFSRLQARGYTCAAISKNLELDEEPNDDNETETVDTPEEKALEKAVDASLATEMTDLSMDEAKKIAVKYFNDHRLPGRDVISEAGREMKFGQPTFVFEFNQSPNEFDLIFSSKGEYLGTEH